MNVEMGNMRLMVLTMAMSLNVGGLAGAADDTGNSATGSKAEKAESAYNTALRPIEDEPGLPRVLLLGDSISIGYTLPAREELKGFANVHRAPVNCVETERGLASLDAWLGDGKWDVIHFNWGLHDLKYEDGTQRVPIDEYTANLRKIVGKLKATGAKLIWATTTPVPSDLRPGDVVRKSEDVLLYNSAADRVMRENGVQINDLFSFAQANIANLQQPQNVHFTDAGSAELGTKVASEIRRALNTR